MLPEFCEDLGETFWPFVLASGELALFTRGFRVVVFFGAGLVAAVDDLEAVRVVRAGAAGAAVAAFVRVDARVDGARGLPAMLRLSEC